MRLMIGDKVTVKEPIQAYDSRAMIIPGQKGVISEIVPCYCGNHSLYVIDWYTDDGVRRRASVYAVSLRRLRE